MTKEKEKPRRNTFLQGTGKLLVGIVGIVSLIASFLCAVCPFVNPSTFVWTAFFGLAFWLIFFANIIILIILIFLKSRRILLIPILALLVSIPGFVKSFSFGEKKDFDSEIKVMTYNVGVFRDYKVNSRAVSEVKKTIAALIKEYAPDIVCLQESGKWPKNTASVFAKMIGYKYFSCNHKNGNSYFSKYPIKKTNLLSEEGIDKFADIREVVLDKDKSFYLVNCHFNSFGISRQEIDYINDARNIMKDSEKHGKSVISKLKRGFERRTETTKILVENVPVDDVPLVICGDFNDTPLSYTYHKMTTSGLQDAFITNSFGIGKTYCGSLPLLRIDYFWYNDMIEVFDYKRIKKTTSDHYPLMLTFDIKDEVEEEEKQ